MARFFLFGIGSTLGALIDLTLGMALLRLGFSAWTALGLAMIVSASVVYVFHQKRTFGGVYSSALRLRRLGMFLVSTAAIYVFRVLVFEWLREGGLADFPALGLALVASVVVNYTVSRALIFSRFGGD